MATLLLALICELNNPCQNGGTCSEVDPGDTATCDCPTDYTGSNCETRKMFPLIVAQCTLYVHVYMCVHVRYLVFKYVYGQIKMCLNMHIDV